MQPTILLSRILTSVWWCSKHQWRPMLKLHCRRWPYDLNASTYHTACGLPLTKFGLFETTVNHTTRNDVRRRFCILVVNHESHCTSLTNFDGSVLAWRCSQLTITCDNRYLFSTTTECEDIIATTETAIRWHHLAKLLEQLAYHSPAILTTWCHHLSDQRTPADWWMEHTAYHFRPVQKLAIIKNSNRSKQLWERHLATRAGRSTNTEWRVAADWTN